MPTIYVRNPETGEFELVCTGGEATDATLSQVGKPADAAAVGDKFTEQQALIENTLFESKAYTDTEIALLVNSAPETLDTLGELATAFEENEDVVAALDAAITTKANVSDLETIQSLVSTNTANISSLQSQVLLDSFVIADAITGDLYKIQIQNGQLVTFPVE